MTNITYKLNVTDYDADGTVVPDSLPEYNNPLFDDFGPANDVLWDLVNQFNGIPQVRIKGMPVAHPTMVQIRVDFLHNSDDGHLALDGYQVLTITSIQCDHNGVFATSEDPNETQFCGHCESNVQNRDL